jgi:hypothetical protein
LVGVAGTRVLVGVGVLVAVDGTRVLVAVGVEVIVAVLVAVGTGVRVAVAVGAGFLAASTGTGDAWNAEASVPISRAAARVLTTVLRVMIYRYLQRTWLWMGC